MKKLYLSAMAMAAMVCMTAAAQDVKIKGIGHNKRDNDNNQMESQWLGSLYDENGNYIKTAFIVDQGIYAMNFDGSTLTSPVKEPAVNKNDIVQNGKVDSEKGLWANNFNLMVGNSGAAYVNGKLVTVFSRDEQSTVRSAHMGCHHWRPAHRCHIPQVGHSGVGRNVVQSQGRKGLRTLLPNRERPACRSNRRPGLFRG